MELFTITQVTKQLNITKRTLQHYEYLGLFTPIKKEDYAYRMYDSATILRIQQILILRKLRIPLKHIAEVLQSSEAAEALKMFEIKLDEIKDEIDALTTIRSVIGSFVERLNLNARLELLEDKNILALLDSMKFSQTKFQESLLGDVKGLKENVTMATLDQANKTLDKLSNNEVRIIYLPPMTIAASYASGEDCEGKAMEQTKQLLVLGADLQSKKPDSRSLCFDCSQGMTGYGEASKTYAVWTSIPDDMDVPAPLIKLQFEGGIYAAHILRDWDFSDLYRLRKWAENHSKYANDSETVRWKSSEPVLWGGYFEENLNWFNWLKGGVKHQLDLLVPIRPVEV